MKGVVFLGDRKLQLKEFPNPIPGPRDVILEIKASGMCGVAREVLVTRNAKITQ
jgi:threonine dehydrogenase-like Zn-dependent dehydrogenase